MIAVTVQIVNMHVTLPAAQEMTDLCTYFMLIRKYLLLRTQIYTRELEACSRYMLELNS